MTAARVFRRVVLAPLIVGLAVLCLVTLPVWLIAAVVLSPLLPGRWRVLRILSIALMYLLAEALMLIAFFVLWVVSGFGWKLHTPWFERAHYQLAEWVLVVFFREARRVLHLQIESRGDEPTPGKPLLVCCRHAGPGDSFTLMYALLHWYEREPRVVLKHTLVWDPMIDVLMSRIPARFVNPNPDGGSDIEERIADLASDLDDNDAFVIFPEGGNFTPNRRVKAVERLRRVGLDAMADRAESMTHVLAPRPGGLLAALDAAPEADVVLVAHTGLDHLETIADVWRELPTDKLLVMQWWRVPREEIPAGREERIEWLYGWWEEIDRWIGDNKPAELS